MSIDNITPQEWNNMSRTTTTSTLSVDEVNHPVHYNNGKVECIEAIEAASSKEEFQGYLRGNVLKYVWRYKYKDGAKDLRKALWYLKKLRESVEQ